MVKSSCRGLPKMGSRGQEEAPFSLLLAVAMMAMVLPIAAHLFTTFQGWECEQRIENNLETFARELELAATLGGGQRIVDVDLSLYSCPGIRVDNFTLKKPDPQRCQETCHDPNCRVLEAIFEDFDGDTGESLGLSVAVPPVCVRIPVNVEFLSYGCSEFEYNNNQLEDLTTTSAIEDDVLGPGFYRIALIKKGYKVWVCRVPSERFD